MSVKENFTIAYIEDDRLTRDALADSLKLHNFKINTYDDPSQIIPDIKKGNIPDLIITDIRMPHMDGFTFLRYLKEQNLDIPALILSAFETKEYLKESLELNIKKFFQKPITNVKLLVDEINISISYKKKIQQNIVATRMNHELLEYVIYSKTDLRGNIVDVSNAFCTLSGYSKNELIGKSHSIVQNSKMNKDIFKTLWKTITQQKEWQGTILNKNKDGYDYWVDTIIKPEYDSSFNHIGYISLRTETTAKHQYQIEQKKLLEKKEEELQVTQNALISSLDDYRLYFTYAPNPYIIINKDYTIIDYNKKSLSDFPIDLHTKTLNIKSLMPEQSFKILEASNFCMDEKKDYCKLQITMHDRSGNLLRYELTMMKHPSKKDQYALRFTDIEEEIKYKEKLELQIEQQIKEIRQQHEIMSHTNKMASLGEMLTNIAHQWRQPLNAISIFSSSVLLKHEMNILDDQYLQESMKRINEQTQNLSQTINVFTNFIDNDDTYIQISIEKLFKEALHLVSSSLSHHNINLTLDFNPKEILLHIPLGKMIEVIVNIINNSIDQLTQKNGEKWIDVKVYKKNNFVIFTFEDNGDGIDETILPKIFEPYFTTKHQSQGTGLGLHNCYKTVTDILHGQISASNTKNGALITIKIPV